MPMARNIRARFGLRSFLICFTVLAVLCSLGAYTMAMAAFVIALLHLVLLQLSARFADAYPKNRNPILRRRLVHSVPSNDAPIIFLICYIVFFYCWHMLPLFFTPQNIRSIWLSPTPFGISLNVMEHCVIAMLNIFAYVNLFGVSYGTGHVCPRNCAMTACSSVVLLATHFAIPYA